MSLAWLAYVPVPGLAVAAAFSARDDPRTRYHAWQGGMLVGLLWIGLLLIGLLGQASGNPGFQTTIGALSLAWLAAGLGGIVYGAVGATRGLYVRVRPVWDLLAALQR